MYSLISNWWLVESYLIDGIGLVSWLFWGIFTWYYFRVREVRLNPHQVRLKRTSENSELGKTQISFLGGGDLWWVGWGIQGEGMWGGVCEVRYARWGLGGGDLWWVGWGMRGEVYEVGYVCWGTLVGICEVIFTWGEIYMRWHLCKVGFTRVT